MEIAGACAGGGPDELPAVLHIEADRIEGMVIHAGVHREERPAAFQLEMAIEGRERAEGLALAIAPEERELMHAQVDAADDVAFAIMVNRTAGAALGLGADRRKTSDGGNG